MYEQRMIRQGLSWNGVEDLVNKLTQAIKADGKSYGAIVGVSRGGLIPAVMLAHRLRINEIFAAHQKLYMQRRVLLVDDIYDTGATYLRLSEALEVPLDFAVLLDKYPHNARTKPSYVGRNMLKPAWIDFPWEKK